MSEKGSQPESGSLNLIPWPHSVDQGRGRLRLESAALAVVFEAASSPPLERAVARLAADVANLTGLPAAEQVPVRIRTGLLESVAPGLEEDESYWLVIDDAGIYLDAENPWGALRGVATLTQLIGTDGSVPHVAIEDRARFSWRGLLLDPARHFLPLDAVLRTLDGMARCKLNVLHLHLTDDQGFRFQVPDYPKLASADCYSESDIRRIVEHAASLGIRVVPEVDMPGHVTSWLTAYPELGCRQVQAAERFGVHAACLDPTSDAVYATIGSILDTLVNLFPDPCLHIGGDEVSPRWWLEDPNVQSLMAAEGLADARAVQGYFNRRVGEMVAARGRQVVAWDEVIDAGMDAGWIIEAWRGVTMRDRVTAAGNRVVLSAPYYLDLHYPTDVHYGFDPGAAQAALVEREDELTRDPRLEHVAGGIRWTEQWREGAVVAPSSGSEDSEASEALLLGGEACLWSELVTADVLDLRLWQRLPAVAERFWSDATLTDARDVSRRQDVFICRSLPLCGIDLAAQTAGRWRELGIAETWDDLLEMLEPVKWYGRLLGAEALAARLAGSEMPQARPYDLDSPLDQLIDHLPVESHVAREMAELCEQASGEGAQAQPARDALQTRLKRWRQVGTSSSAAPQGLGPLAENLARLGTLIEQRLVADTPATEKELADLLVPEGEFMLALPPALHRWLTAA